jgi:hypothetical protein
MKNSIKIELVNNENYYEYSIDGLPSFKSIFIYPSWPNTPLCETIPDVTQCERFHRLYYTKIFHPNNDGFNDMANKEMGDYLNSRGRILTIWEIDKS